MKSMVYWDEFLDAVEDFLDLVMAWNRVNF